VISAMRKGIAVDDEEGVGRASCHGLPSLLNWVQLTEE
jgi:hypothetical protein